VIYAPGGAQGVGRCKRNALYEANICCSTIDEEVTWQKKKFSKVSALVYLLNKATVVLTLENLD
jgi:hypothetical protein